MYLELKCMTINRWNGGANAVKLFKDSTIIDSNNMNYHKSKAYIDITRISTKQNSKYVTNKLLEWKME